VTPVMKQDYENFKINDDDRNHYEKLIGMKAKISPNDPFYKKQGL
jgi:hypothetical protein